MPREHPDRIACAGPASSTQQGWPLGYVLLCLPGWVFVSMLANHLARVTSGPECRVHPITMEVSPVEMTKTSTTTQKRAAPASYEEALAELERLVASMEAGQLPLDQLLGSYQRGAELLGYCRSRLQAVESQVKLLEDGELKVWEGS